MAELPEENTARIASAMQFLGGLRDRAALIVRAREFGFGWQAVAVAAGHFVECYLAGKTVVEADIVKAKCRRLPMIENRVVDARVV